MWRYVAPCRGPEISRGPGRLSSGTAAGSAALASHCFASGGIFFREPGRLPGAGARIRAGKGSVRAPGVPLTAAYCPGASGALWRGCCPSCIVPLSHRKVWGLPIALPGGAAVVTSRTSGIRRSGAGCQVTGRTGAITRAGDRPAWSDMRPGPNRRTRAILSRRPHAGQAAGSRVAAVHRRPHPEHRRRTRGESVSVIGVTPPGPRRSNRILPRCTDRRSTGKTPGASGAGH